MASALGRTGLAPGGFFIRNLSTSSPLPKWGLGFHMAKTHWTNVSYEITKINLYKDGRRGKAWGIAYKDGLPAAENKKISGVHKHCWRYVPNSKGTEESTPKLEVRAA